MPEPSAESTLRPVVEREPLEGAAARRVTRALVWRVAAGAVLVVALAVYAAVVDELPDLPLWWDVALASFVLIPATMALVWLALPLHGWDGVAVLGVGLTTVALASAGADLDIVGNLAKALAVVALAFAFLRFFERPWWVGLVALAIPAVDALSVWRGPTRHIVEEEPGVFDLLSIAFPVPDGSFQLGLPDVLFFSLFLGAAARWRMRTAVSWVLMTASFGATMALALWLDPFGLGGLPALPLLSVAFLVANGDRLLRSLRPPEERAPVIHLRPVPDPEPETGAAREPRSRLAVGLADCHDGWLAVGIEDGRFAWSERRPTLAAALELARDADVVGIDAVSADGIADRLYLGPEARRVYTDFLGKLVAASDDAEAAALVRDLGWAGVTQESLAFRRRAVELAEQRDERLVEIDDGPSGRDVLVRTGIEVPREAVRAAAAASRATESPQAN
jgi:hypothetical protein